jgi:sugar lactone lactonase YvrE
MATGRIDRVAGNGEAQVPKDGTPAKEAPLLDPRAAAVDRHGRVYILERSGNALRVVGTDGKIKTVLKDLASPKHLCIDRNDNVIIADTSGHRILKFLPRAEGDNLVVLAGTGKKGPSGAGGPALETSLDEPHGVRVHPSGALYIVDSMNDRVFRLEGAAAVPR